MPSPLTTTLIGFGAVLTASSATAGCVLAALGVGFELATTYIAASTDEDDL